MARGLREGIEEALLEARVAAFKKRLDMERMQQDPDVEGVPPVVPTNVPAHTCELPPPSSPMTPPVSVRGRRLT